MLSVLMGCEAPPPDAPRQCNGSVELCDRRFDEVTLAGTHNSMSNAEDGWYVPAQPDGLRAQMEFGVRAMLLDTYEVEGEAFFCHGTCALGSLAMVEGLTTVRDFLDDHPDEVMAFIMQDSITFDQTAAAFTESGLHELVYPHPVGERWPTLGTMIENDRRLVVTAEAGGQVDGWYQRAWSAYFDTPFEFTTAAEFSCDLNRGAETNDLFLVNHWVEDPFPDEAVAADVNETDVLYPRAAACASERHHVVNLLAVDWYTAGDLLNVVDSLNTR